MPENDKKKPMAVKLPARPANGLFTPMTPDECETRFKYIKYIKKDGFAWIIFNRPDVFNSYNFDTMLELIIAFDDIAMDDRIGAVILRGAGDRAFCTGGDVKEYAEKIVGGKSQDMWHWMNVFVRAHEALRNTGKIVIAAINGICVGGGNEWNLSCDFAIMADTEWKEKHGVQVPTRYIKQVGTSVGSVAAGGATQFLPLVVGLRRAKQILLFNEPIPPETCLEWGLVNEVVPYNDLDTAAEEWAKKALKQFPGGTRSTLAQLNVLPNMVWAMTMGPAKDILVRNMGGIESYLGMQGFTQKREVDHDSVRVAMAEGADGESLHGPYLYICPDCGTEGLPQFFDFCGACGKELEVPSP